MKEEKEKRKGEENRKEERERGVSNKKEIGTGCIK